MTGAIQPPASEKEEIAATSRRLAAARTKGELCGILAEEVSGYTVADLQVIGGRLFSEVDALPEPYRSRVRPFFHEQLFGAHHRLLLMYRSGAFRQDQDPIRDRETFGKFCAMIPEGCFTWDELAERTPFHYSPKHRFFYYLMAAFTMFVLEKPGHPVGMPFPGGFSVEDRNGIYYCLIRDREKEVFFSICNFCPAKQAEENAPRAG
ncbi:DUF2115 domain-containing protein [Methanoregula sp.]|uniref:DUF2115 domain-containing protein n=1 Tax=Methanoregula sp. TaxID=2052170 RepID=UPI002CBEE880|nr:DUF2115 domain-containing protein [Methanoregula sp.]HVP97643.1 DUF2115 domain-containing protein [Methanoregula sp.]